MAAAAVARLALLGPLALSEGVAFHRNSSPGSLTSTDSRSPGRLEIEMVALYALAAAFGIGVLGSERILRSSSSSNAASSSGSAVCNPASADRDSRC